ncbi:MAG: hypothetical protein M3Y87_23730, partial [Myxococcota bacterium]|nr:hypothetical protein [Myxococcota bacterium]
MSRAPACALAAVAILAFAPSLAVAQTRWAVLSAASSRDEAPRARDVGEHALAALEAQGEAVTARERAASRIERELSRSFAPAPDDLAARVADVSETVLADIVAGRTARARDAGEPMLDAAEEHIVALGRIETAARDVANLCLFLVRAELQDRRPDQARTLLERCVRNLPRIDAEGRMHPPEIGEMLEEIRPSSRRAEQQGTLSVQGAAGEPDGCAVRVNGSRVGSTPWARVALPAGVYGVQVECDPAIPGRVFAASIEPGETTRLTVMARLSQSLETHGGVALVYASPAELAARIAADVAQLGSVLGVERVLVGVVDAGAVTVRAFEIVPGSSLARLTGSTPVAEPFDASSSLEAVQRARSGRQAPGATVEPPV